MHGPFFITLNKFDWKNMPTISEDFVACPPRFIMTHTILVLIGGNPLAPNFQTGTGRFFLEDANTGPGTCFLRNAPFLSLDRFDAFLLFAGPNGNNTAALPNNVGLFLTSDMHGCQFMAYGPDRNNLTVEHNNFIGDPTQYATRYATIQAQNHAVFIALRPVQNAQPAANEYNFQLGANVIGMRKADGWHFFVRIATTEAYGGTREL